MKIKRRRTRQVRIGNVKIGGRAPISIQSMAKTPIIDVSKILREIERLRNAGCEIVRVAVRDEESAGCLANLKKRIEQGEFHAKEEAPYRQGSKEEKAH